MLSFHPALDYLACNACRNVTNQLDGSVCTWLGHRPPENRYKSSLVQAGKIAEAAEYVRRIREANARAAEAAKRAAERHSQWQKNDIVSCSVEMRE